MKKAICVFCSSSNHLGDGFVKLAKDVGKLIGEADFDLIYGGSNTGLMYHLATQAKQNGAQIIGIVPRQLHERLNTGLDELIITKDLYERKARMIERADAFLVLPGGFGTLDEFLEVVIQKLLTPDARQLVVLNHAQYFEPILNQFEKLIELRFADATARQLFTVVTDPAAAITIIKKGMRLSKVRSDD